MSNKEDILKKYRANVREKYDMPSLDDLHAITYNDPLMQFINMSETVGGKVVEKAYALDDETIVGYTSMRYAMERWDPNYLAEVPLDLVEGLGLSVAAPRLEAQQEG